MRDLLLVVFLFVAIFYSFKRPVAGVAAWMWIALMAPTEWAFGFSQTFRMNLTIVLFVALSYFIWKEKPKVKFTAVHFWVFFFCFWMLVSSVLHQRVDSSYVWFKYIEFIKVIVLFSFISLTVKTKKDIDTIVWAIVLGLSAYSAMEGVKFLLSAGSHRIVGRSGILADRNDLAVAINMSIPLVLYLWSVTTDKKLRLGLLGIAGLCAVAIVGTYSRGGFIGLSILAFAMWLRSEKKAIFLIIGLMAIPVLYATAPAEWKDRQATIETASAEDGSFIGRLWAWKIATLIAIDNPITGGGFKATTDPLLWRTYADETPNFGPIETPPIPPELRPKAAHNIYFQVLASAGFAGLTIFLLMLLTGYLKALSIARKAAKENIEWRKNLANAISLSLVGYGITGLNVSLAYFELVYAMLALLCVLSIYQMKGSGPDANIKRSI
ncbi:putative O-glycosylation ligase, exosortase A system-associated [Thalassotalea euphylliae]|uniref:Putative O-glycosylation ligase, exosortase A system-associated n=1 Tax=Thalassotalea euphylliae TaxID=1655234 RepID=A0A3E0UAR2_9GAMM|nr:putative O-glycosylation ligase, exosortase A system-associated [Thalassotalea euphylliae]REL33979.1 putative O-glycosylation ligase, exosortase A system-associated [Thalassotalea euphylliae]